MEIEAKTLIEVITLQRNSALDEVAVLQARVLMLEAQLKEAQRRQVEREAA